MAALRHAGRRLCERALQRGGPQVIPSGRRSMFISIGGTPKPTTAAAQEELKMQFQKKKEELFDVLVELSRTRTYPSLSWEAFQVNQLAARLVGKVEPRPGDYYWRSYRLQGRLNTFLVSYLFLHFVYMEHFWIPKKQREDGATSNNSEAKILPDSDENQIRT
ncbi:uncharacterized protein LOC119311670 [Triticum dicoccoides]|uniref:Uncharacterized protein n=1 Tax=Triticum turgidum subsp. durum TaxID=4567 RepID=A0A9R0R630_TRITD|nr:uncharacterized protein LOC119311670 [Triticum dicoccoides]VAH22694.1 unnamed protein product [Triticum turgidum subsp. durum]